MAYPKGFSDVDVRKDLALKLCQQIDAYTSSMSSSDDDISNTDRWNRADDVYYEAIVLSSLQHIDDAQHYNIAILPQRCEAIANTVCGNISSADPYFLFKSAGQQVDNLEGLQQTVHYALDIARFDRRIREAALQAALKGRGCLRLRYTTINENFLADWEDVDTMVGDDAPDPEASARGEVEQPVSGGNVRYSGLVIDSFKPEDMVCYPAWEKDIVNVTMIGNVFTQRHQDILNKQDAGRYFKDAVVTLSNDGDQAAQSVVPYVEDYGQKCYDLITRLPKDGKPGMEAWYRATVLYNNRELLALEPFDLPTPWYFCPTMKGDIDRFWPRRSVADRLIEIQTIYNDAWTLIILGTAAASHLDVAVSNWAGQMQTAPSGLRNFLFFRGTPGFTPIPSSFNADGVTWIIENCERVADAISRFAQVGLGAEVPSDTTATATAAQVQGQNAGSEDYTVDFGLELERMADMARFLLNMNWDAFYASHGEAVTLKKKEDLTMRCQVEVNGKTPADTPAATIGKMQSLIHALQVLGIQPSPSTRTVNIDALADVLLNNLNLTSSTSKILQEQQNDPENPNAGIPASNVPPGVPGAPGGANALPDPQILQNLAAQLKGGLATQQMAQANGGPPPGIAPGGTGPAMGPSLPPVGPNIPT